MAHSREDMTRFEAEEILDLPERYGMAEVRSAFKELAQKYHPDNAARNGISPELAQKKMTEVNKAYGYMRSLFAKGQVGSLHRDYAGGTHGKKGVGVHFDPSGSRAVDTQVDDSLFWDENGNPRSAVAENEANRAADAPGHGMRRFILGPVFLRAVLVAILALVWWLNFPLLGPGAGRIDLSGNFDAGRLADFLAAVIYPSYFLLYELFTGHISGAIREVVNGIVSNATRVHVEVRRKGSYQSDVSSLFGVQVYSVLEIPLAVWLLGRGLAVPDGAEHLVFLGLAIAVTVDLMIGFFGTGLAVGLGHWISDKVEKRYVTARMAMLKRCGQWSTGAHAQGNVR